MYIPKVWFQNHWFIFMICCNVVSIPAGIPCVFFSRQQVHLVPNNKFNQWAQRPCNEACTFSHVIKHTCHYLLDLPLLRCVPGVGLHVQHLLDLHLLKCVPGVDLHTTSKCQLACHILTCVFASSTCHSLSCKPLPSCHIQQLHANKITDQCTQHTYKCMHTYIYRTTHIRTHTHT